MGRLKQILYNFWHQLDRDEKALLLLPAGLFFIIIISLLIG